MAGVVPGPGGEGVLPDSGVRRCPYGTGVLQHLRQNDMFLCFPQKAFCTLAKGEDMKINSEKKKLIRATKA